ncbi:uncharacterized protein PADG_00387 [Paracoccidioides brasiliensis Pb18]|uniref:Methyltransferase type 11 domain-containing protein n=2 Tax=Paracoccidioides brasiliensis TaxID=121759 RepID=C1G0J7_PARBD|nr:uncharacterized protein PADG_00387 [Paracoccidioides brasiliensis Pb18]EEH44098.2 hypothetical protein PADG_00387 [Paracoccidioides brasiliensis Pb18]ODH27614.1 hypothetical protein ACO22_04149 [Paracoccidioides brasiliensis]ODH50781.1 hypothetical protein GX48_03098 [Paracoccidioides brasiliensis]
MLTPDSPIQLDAASDETDSTIYTDYDSIASTLPNYIYQNGRRYTSQGVKYLLPNDEREQERLDFLHHIFRLTLDGDLCYTKLENPQRILDIGTGTVAEIYPGAHVIGTDLSPIQPGGIPDNVEFIVDDALQEWTFPESSVDFIHIRCLGGSIPDWPQLLSQCYKVIRPGGQIELSEARTQLCCDDGSFPEESLCKKWMKEHQRLAKKCGFHFDVFPEFRGWAYNAGFVDVDTSEKIVPAGTWPRDRNLKRRGAYFMAQLLDFALDSYSVALFTRGGGWHEEEVRGLLNGVKAELRTNKMHLYTHFSFCIARKPLNG